MMKGNYMKRTALVAALLPIAILSGCSSWLNTAGEDEFSCPGMPQGIICKSPMAVYKSTEQSPALTDSDMPIGQKAPNVKYGDDMGKTAGSEHNLKVSNGMPGPAVAELARPVRVPAQVMRIWIAPWIDSKDDLHFPSYLFTEIQPRTWSFGKSEYSGQGMVVPHLELTAVPPVSVAAPKSENVAAEPTNYGPQVSSSAIPSTTDINLN